MPDLPSYDRSHESPRTQTMRAAATGCLIGCLLMSVVLTNGWLVLVGLALFAGIAFIDGMIDNVIESRNARRR